MQNKPHWIDLCQQASVEQDPEKLIELITEINHLLDERKNGCDRRTASRKTPLNAGGSYFAAPRKLRFLMIVQGLRGRRSDHRNCLVGLLYVIELQTNDNQLLRLCQPKR